MAGHATTTALLTEGVVVVHRADPQRLFLTPDRIGHTVEELLRDVSPTTLTGAVATVDAAPDGEPVAAGSHVALVFAAANRDPRVFAEPDTIDFARDPNPHLAFSAGAHYCIGAPLARLHAQVALPALFERLTDLRPTGAAVWTGSVPVRQVSELPVTWAGRSERPPGA